ncbi:MAG: hypothetical protein RLZZ15_3905 [Verrucomicrobiota bacterium]
MVAQVAVVVAIGLQVAFGFGAAPTVRSVDLAVAVPASLAGWTVRDEPLGTTEASSAWVARTLNFDRAVQRVYTRGERKFTVFAAYWGRGKMPARTIAIHTPDCCWTRAGYRCTAAKFHQTLRPGGVALHPAEWRTFVGPGGEREHALFWLVSGGAPFEFGEMVDGAGDPWLTAKAFVRDTVRGCEEAIYVNVSTNLAFDELVADADFQIVLRQLAQAGLAAPAAR